MRLLSTNTSTFTHAHEFGEVADKSSKRLSHFSFFGRFATHLAIAAISCLKT
jgi:hypothetical protein